MTIENIRKGIKKGIVTELGYSKAHHADIYNIYVGNGQWALIMLHREASGKVTTIRTFAGATPTHIQEAN